RLPAVQCDREGRTHGHFGLTEPDVAADEPIHGARCLEVLLDRLDRPLLVLRLPVGEARLEPLEPVLLEVEGDAGAGLTLGVQREQLARELADRRARTVLEQLPSLAPELGQRRAASVGPDVA